MPAQPATQGLKIATPTFVRWHDIRNYPRYKQNMAAWTFQLVFVLSMRIPSSSRRFCLCTHRDELLQRILSPPEFGTDNVVVHAAKISDKPIQATAKAAHSRKAI